MTGYRHRGLTETARKFHTLTSSRYPALSMSDPAGRLIDKLHDSWVRVGQGLPQLQNILLTLGHASADSVPWKVLE